MVTYSKTKKAQRARRVFRVRKKLRGSAHIPRLSVVKSLKHIGAQIIDDEKGVTLIGYSTLNKELRGEKRSKELAKKVGEKLAKLAMEKNIKKVVFDRGRFKFHGLIAALATGAREAGLHF